MVKDENGLYAARRRTAFYTALAILIVLALLWRLRSKKEQFHSFSETRVLMDTIVEVRVFTPDSVQAYRAIWAAFDEMGRVAGFLSNYDPQSEVSRLNAHAGQGRVKVSRKLYTFLKRSVEWSRMTEGAFDITVGPVLQLWGFSGIKPRVPPKSSIEAELQRVGYEYISLDPNGSWVSLTKRGMSLDLGGIAKGYAVERAVEVLRGQGIGSAIVDAGGDLRILGPSPDGKRWRIGIRHPRRVDEMIGVVEVDSGAVATSGDYERFFVERGVRYHHIIDPHTGMPARKCASVTILAPSALDADALATAVFVLGPQKGMELINRISEAEGVIFYEEGGKIRNVISEGLKGKVQFNLGQDHAKNADYRGSGFSRISSM